MGAEALRQFRERDLPLALARRGKTLEERTDTTPEQPYNGHHEERPQEVKETIQRSTWKTLIFPEGFVVNSNGNGECTVIIPPLTGALPNVVEQRAVLHHIEEGDAYTVDGSGPMHGRALIQALLKLQERANWNALPECTVSPKRSNGVHHITRAIAFALALALSNVVHATSKHWELMRRPIPAEPAPTLEIPAAWLPIIQAVFPQQPQRIWLNRAKENEPPPAPPPVPGPPPRDLPHAG